MKRDRVFLVLLLVVLLQSKISADISEPVYINSYDLSVIGTNAYIIKAEGGINRLIQYSFPALEQGASLTLSSDFSYANAYSNAVVVYNYQYEQTTDQTFAPEENPSKSVAVYKDIVDINSYDANLNFLSSVTLENEYYYSYTTNEETSTLDAANSGAEKAPSNKCGPKGKKKGKCNKVLL